jgi:hypothetical protein
MVSVWCIVSVRPKCRFSFSVRVMVSARGIVSIRLRLVLGLGI